MSARSYGTLQRFFIQMRPGCATCTSHASSSLSALTLSKPRWSDSLPRCGARVSKFRSSMKPSSVCGRRFFSTTASAQSGLHAGRPPADDANSGGSPVREVGLAPASPLSSRSEGRLGDAVEEVKRGEDLPLGARSPPKGWGGGGGLLYIEPSRFGGSVELSLL